MQDQHDGAELDPTKKFQPWYKERLRTKYIKTKKPSEPMKVMASKDWLFLKDGLDDFRSGVPPEQQDVFIKPDRGLGPVLSKQEHPNVKHTLPSGLNKEQMCFSKELPQKERRMQHIESVAAQLRQHPLALYPHFEESLPAYIADDIIELLDPEMRLLEEEDENEEMTDDMEEQDTFPTTSRRTSRLQREETEDEIAEYLKNPFKWLLDRKEKKSNSRSESPSEDENVKRVTKQFCEWAGGLSDKYPIEEATLTSYFASGYETKPALSVPIHVVELSNVPPELRATASAVRSTLKSASTAPDHVPDVKPKAKKGNKTRFGAWYLPPKMWKKMPQGEFLVNQSEEKVSKPHQKKVIQLETELATLHGTAAFLRYVETEKNQQTPKFLRNVSKLKDELAPVDS